jgi:hypothetical protein
MIQLMHRARQQWQRDRTAACSMAIIRKPKRLRLPEEKTKIQHPQRTKSLVRSRIKSMPDRRIVLQSQNKRLVPRFNKPITILAK